jgi:glycosyltransferase involved in cell wall biosynthesis
MRNPLVSCIMPTKNRRRFVQRAIEMFLAQDFHPFDVELIVIEDGDDHCQDLIAAIQSPYMARYVRFEGTLGAKLNEGARLASGEFVINWDDDDYQHPGRISKTFDLFRMTGAKMLAMSSMVFYREGDPTGWEWNGNYGFDGPGSGHAFEREWVLANPHPDTTVGEDNIIRDIAKEQGVLSTLSGTQLVIACTHKGHCSPRQMPNETAMFKQYGLIADNWREIPTDQFSWVQKWAFDQVPA